MVVDCPVNEAHVHLATRLPNVKHKATFRTFVLLHGLPKGGLVD